MNNQSDKRSFIKLLTHKDGEINEDIVSALPFLAIRSKSLLEQPVRKVRSDKIDLDFISEFVHNYCRYVDTSTIIDPVACSLIMLYIMSQS